MNDMSHFASILQKLRKKTPEEVRLQDGFGKQAEMMRTWRGAAGRSRCGQRRQEKLGCRQSTAVYGGQAPATPPGTPSPTRRPTPDSRAKHL